MHRFFHADIEWLEVKWLFFVLFLYIQNGSYLLAGDETVLQRAGKWTFGLYRFFSSMADKVVPGVGFFVFALVTMRKRQAYGQKHMKTNSVRFTAQNLFVWLIVPTLLCAFFIVHKIWRDFRRIRLEQAHYNRALQYTKHGNKIAAIEEYRAAIKLDATRDASQVNLGLLLTETGRYDAAIRQWEKMLEADPKNSMLLYYKGLCLSRAGRTAEAKQAYRQAVQTGNTDRWAQMASQSLH